MRYLFILLLIPCYCFALSCPTNGLILDTGYSVQIVEQLCGESIGVKRYNRKTAIMEQWMYDKSKGNSDIRLSLLFNEGRLSNINIYDSRPRNNPACLTQNNDPQNNDPQNNDHCFPVELNVSHSNLCERVIQTGNNTDYIKSACGKPAQQRVLESREARILELKYDASTPNVLVFADGKLRALK